LPELTIDEEFRFLLPMLDNETFALLEENILENGIRDAIVTWNNVIIDGHNRHTVAMKHGIPFSTVSMEFESRDDVVIWIISTQVSRRNLTPIQLSYYRGTHYNADKRRLANQYNVSRDTIKRDAQVANAITAIGRESPEAKRKILSGEASISRKQLRELSAGSGDDITEIAESINEGLTERRRASVSSIAQAEGRYPVDQGDGGVQSLDEVFAGFADSVHGELHDLSGKYTLAELKAALRVFIDTLEDLYGRM
jgi:hypothetical protein